MKILVFTEKHGNRYMKASTQEELQESCLKVLRDRMDDGWYYEPEEPYQPTVSKEDAEKLPDPFRGMALENLVKYAKDRKFYEREKKWFETAKAEVKDPKGLAAKLLGWRAQAKYEGFEIVEVE